MQAMKIYAHSMFCSVKYEEQKLALLVKWMFNELLKLKQPTLQYEVFFLPYWTHLGRMCPRNLWETLDYSQWKPWSTSTVEVKSRQCASWDMQAHVSVIQVYCTVVHVCATVFWLYVVPPQQNRRESFKILIRTLSTITITLSVSTVCRYNTQAYKFAQLITRQ